MWRTSVWSCLFVLFGASGGAAKVLRELLQNATHGFGSPVPLDMARSSVDDLFEGCNDRMERKIKSEFLPNEKKKNQNFSLAWDVAEKYYNKNWKPKPKRRHTGTLNKEQIMAVHAYTLEKPDFYHEFNTAVRMQRQQYTTTFPYHAMHFFLTSALKALNSRKERCLTSYRRVGIKFTAAVGKEMRFGAFTSSSLGQYSENEKFGYETCFEIDSCFGADISLYSKFGESEAEVLIPPYEVFKVTNIKKRSEEKELPCKVVLKVKSTEKPLSNSNCAFFPEI